MNSTPITIAGPCFVQRGAVSFLTSGDVTVDITKDTSEITVSHLGKVGEKLTALKAEVKFKPVEFNNLDALFPFLGWTLGQSIFGATSTPTHIFGVDGKKWTFFRTAFTGVGAIGAGVEVDLLGEFTLTAYVDPARGLDELDGLYEVTTATFTAPALLPAKMLSVPFVGKYGDLYFDLEEGATVEFDVKLSERKCDRLGVFDQIFSGYDVSTSLKPTGITEEEWATLAKPQGEARRGALLGTGYPDLLLRGTKTGDPLFTLKSAVAKSSGLVWGPEASRFKEISFAGTANLGGAKFTQGVAEEDIEFDAEA